MSFFVLMEMLLVVVMGIYLAYHTHLIFIKVTYRKLLTIVIVGILMGLCLIDLNVFGFLANACICFVFFDLVYLLLYKTKLKQVYRIIYWHGITALVISLIFSFYSLYNAKNTIITTYDININKVFEDKSLMVVSDVHLGTAVSKADLTKIVDHANALKPDGIVLLGDIYDEGTTQDQFDYSLRIFKNLAKDYSVYYVEGNHEIGFQGYSPLKAFNVIDNLKDCGVTVLLDDVIELDDMYLIGRKDYVVKKREELSSIINDIDKTKPLILLDHQPHQYMENKELGIDLQLSGHSHAGQIFPFNYFIDLLPANDMNYGIKQNDNFHAIVSSGLGTWGYAMRSGSHSEIVLVNIISKG